MPACRGAGSEPCYERPRVPAQPDAPSLLTVGLKFQNGRYSAALKITNLANQEIQQHVFGDIIKRSVLGEFKVHLSK